MLSEQKLEIRLSHVICHQDDVRNIHLLKIFPQLSIVVDQMSGMDLWIFFVQGNKTKSSKFHGGGWYPSNVSWIKNSKISPKS